MPFKRAGPAEILRASQKDDAYISSLQNDLSELLRDIAGNRQFMTYRKWIDFLSPLAYYCLTTMSGYQTMGEEYTGVVQVAPNLRMLPSKLRTVVMILLQSFGLGTALKCLSLLLQMPDVRQIVGEERARKIVTAIENNLKYVVDTVLPQINLTAFYLFGIYYTLAKRLTGVNYVLVRHWTGQPYSTFGFKSLGYISALHLTLTLTFKIISWYKNHQRQGTDIQKEDASPCTNPTLRCSLCFDERKGTSATPCGHLFCWTCIMEWLQTKQQCPLCREPVQPSRVIPLKNYEAKTDILLTLQ